jgi:phage terminase small subunit
MPEQPSTKHVDFAIKPAETVSLPLKQQMFCREYIVDLNGSRAAIRAGYAERSARITASKLLTNNNIQEFIQSLIQERIIGLSMNADAVLLGLADLARNATTDSAKIRALELLGKYFNLWSDSFKAPIENKAGGRVVFMMPEKGR